MTVLVGYPGPKGSYSDAATAVLAPQGSRTLDLPSFTAVVEAAVGREVEFGVLPIENSLTGPIAETHDLLYEAPLSIVREATLPIRHCILAPPEAKLEAIKTVHSHPAAFDQCRSLLHGWQVKCVPASTTADAARKVAESGDRSCAAIAGSEAARVYGLELLKEDVGDGDAFTRFVAVAPYTRIDREGAWRTAISFVTNHEPGALYRALAPFAAHGLNLVQLVSRPLPRSDWRYRFDLVLDGHVLDWDVRDALADLRSMAKEVRLYGSYAAELRG